MAVGSGTGGKDFFPSWPALLCPSPGCLVLPPFWGPQGGAGEVGVSRAQLASVLRIGVDEPWLSQEAWSPDRQGNNSSQNGQFFSGWLLCTSFLALWPLLPSAPRERPDLAEAVSPGLAFEKTKQEEGPRGGCPWYFGGQGAHSSVRR